jgi:hypothetical protein
MCAETIDAQALICRHCGYDYRIQARPSGSGETSGLAIASLVLGIVWVCGIGSILALIFGYNARKAIRDSGGAVQGKGMATAGIVLGWIGVSWLLVYIVLFMIGAATAPFTTFE